mgnify:CR=1 FL=1
MIDGAAQARGDALDRHRGQILLEAEPELLRLGRALDALEDSEPVQVGAIRLLLYTGCRKGEVLSLRWGDIAGRLMMLRDSKTGP